MFGFTPVLRCCLPVNIKIVRLVDKTYVSNLSRYQSCWRKNNICCFNNVQKFSTNSRDKELEKISQKEPVLGTTFEATKENIKTAWYGSVVIAGLGLTAALFYVLFQGLFSSNSPNAIYKKAFEKCINNEDVVLKLGDSIKGYGETNSRGRRRHVSHVIYEKDGVNYMRMRFYLKGSIRSATVNLEAEKREKGNYEFRYILVQIDTYPHTIIAVENNVGK